MSFSRWRPYEPHVATYIEKCFTGNTGHVYLGHADATLTHYILDFRSMSQIRQGTGTSRSVRRSLYNRTSPAGQGVMWQWEGDNPGTWHLNDMDISGLLENAFSQRQTMVDLSALPFCLPYKICLSTMSQIRLETKRRRMIRRELLPMPYPPDNGKMQTSSGLPGALQNNTLVSRSQRSGGSTGPVAVPFKKRAISDLTGSSSPYSLRKKHHTQPAASMPSLSKAMSALPGGLSSHVGVISQGHAPLTNSISQGQPPLALNSHFTSLQGYPPAASHNHLPSVLLQSSSSVPGNLNAAAYTSGLQPAMSSVTNILVSPAVPTMQQVANWCSLPTSRSVPALRSSNLSWSRHDNLGQLKGPVKIKNDVDVSSRAKNTAEEVLTKFVTVITDPPKDEDCCICCEKLSQASGYCSNGNDCVVYRLERCSHMFHKLCLHEMYECGQKDGSVQCPSCKTIYGEKCGNCPKGEMEYDILPNHLPTFPNCGTIQIKYDIRPGTQGPEHPHPGKRFTARGFPRYGFLPDNEDGRKVLQLLIIAWKRRLTFTIGQSTTTGESDTVTWNEIHHKTELGSNSTGHGYPDPKYIDNVLMELAVQGVTESDLDT
ncbi:LOW QUALITY PROTEIN: E3 ubiquitin-protein ligase DTX1-like [Liolophura sinensis]|uniref:LOW QUALITY PROTEIN: E3 ubiquitin-protein ligase DTX1-like n=1 Tax=Liolophura sinensis TaxID=3198878 RepID=UPI0031590FEA